MFKITNENYPEVLTCYQNIVIKPDCAFGIKCQDNQDRTKKLLRTSKATDYDVGDFISYDRRCSYSDYQLKFEEGSFVKPSITKDKISLQALT